MGNPRTRLIVLIALFSLTYLGTSLARVHRQNQRRAPDWSAVPYGFESWAGRDAVFDPLYGADPADTSLVRVYAQSKEPSIIAYVGFYGDIATILDVHTPELCYPAQGWHISSFDKPAGGFFRGEQITGSEIMADKSGERRLVRWWYNAGSRPFKTRIRYVYAMLALSAFTGRTDGSMVRLETPVEKAGERAAHARLEQFQGQFLPWLDKALPR